MPGTGDSPNGLAGGKPLQRLREQDDQLELGVVDGAGRGGQVRQLEAGQGVLHQVLDVVGGAHFDELRGAPA
jgi:hypothetical protein